LHKLEREKHIRFFDVKYPDLLGRLHHLSIPKEQWEEVIENGIGVDGSSLPGFKVVQAGDLTIRLDPTSYFFDPFTSAYSFFGNFYLRDAPYPKDPREILRKAADLVRKKTGCDRILFLSELEFYLLDQVKFSLDKTSGYYELVSEEDKKVSTDGFFLTEGSAYQIAPPLDKTTLLRNEVSELLTAFGFPVKYHHHEGGSFSQVEVEINFLPTLKAADGILIGKYITKNLAKKYGKSATFLPKPFPFEPGSGLHLHHYLEKGRVSLFGQRRNRLSDFARRYIAGILYHTPALCALCAPSTNSYRRLSGHFETPTKTSYQFGDRTATIRIPGYIKDYKKMSIEYRIPDATSNPYLAIAGILLAGLDGIEKNFPLKEKSLPSSLKEALEILQEDNDFLTRNGVFPNEVIEFWIERKKLEEELINESPHPREYELYYNC